MGSAETVVHKCPIRDVKNLDPVANPPSESPLKPLQIDANFRLHVLDEERPQTRSGGTGFLPKCVKRRIFGPAGDSGDERVALPQK